MYSAHRARGLFVVVLVVLALGALALGGCGGAAIGAPEKSEDPTSTDAGGTSDPGADAAPAPAPDAGTTTTTTTATGKQLGETCAQNSDCMSAECFVGGMASYCSLRCTTANAATVCVAPFAGVCNNRGYCKK